MTGQEQKLREFGQLMNEHGFDFVSGLIVMIAGLYATRWIIGQVKHLLAKVIKSPSTVSIIANSIGVVFIIVVLVASSIQIGANPKNVMAFLMIVCLVVIGIMTVFRPLVPKLPFKVGNTVKCGNLMGRIEATSLLNTQLRTFDGKTFFVPNRKILDDIVINYHYTKTRRIKVNVTIGYDQDLAKAKQVLEALMIEDARVLPKPSPVVYVLDLVPDGVLIGARCWVNNTEYWVAKCEMMEKTKFRFDREKISFAYPQLEIRHYQPSSSLGG